MMKGECSKNLSAEAEQSGKKKNEKLIKGECSKNVAERIAKWKELHEKNESPEGRRIKEVRKVRECKKEGGKRGPHNEFCTFKGVWQMKSERWVAEITMPNSRGKKLWLGSFETAIEAALSYDVAVRELYGSSGYDLLNIPGYSESTSTSSQHIEQDSENKPSS